MLDRTNIKTKYIKLIQHLHCSKNSAAQLVEILLSRQRSSNFEPISCFERALPQDFAVFNGSLPQTVHSGEDHCWPLFGCDFKSTSYLPISAFRGYPSRLWLPVDKLRIFLSSGTNSGQAGRSRSAFTSEGLRFYKASSLTAFFGVLESRVLPFVDDFLDMSIISLVPPVEKWPDSSLAQMIQWFSEIWSTEFIDPPTPELLKTALEQASNSEKPICLIGTAFHFINLLDDWVAQGLPPFKLPRGSMIIETGGTKGKSRAVERKELYELLSRAFGLTGSSIVSEYGMCELASQAWDYLEDSSKIGIENRKFKFPWWVKLGVMTHPTKISPHGCGALVVQDFARIDLQISSLAAPIQTEDLAETSADGSFQLMGRVPNAPLKGCSLLAEDARALLSTDLTSPITRSKPRAKMLEFSEKNADASASLVRRWFIDLCQDKQAFDCLAAELKSNLLAKEAISDLVAGIPSDVADFAAAGVKSTSHEKIALNWLFIAPASHSLALIHPIASALILGLNLRVRIPNIAGINADNTFLRRAIDLAHEQGFKIAILNANWRIGPHDLEDGEHVLVFGDDETCSKINAFAPGRVHTFGHVTSLTITSRQSLKEATICHRIMRDQLALRQRGCLSSRAVIICGGTREELLRAFTASTPSELCDQKLTTGELAARSMELVRLSQLGFKLAYDFKDINSQQGVPGVIIAAKEIPQSDLSNELATGISRLEMVVPIFILPENITESDVIRKLPKTLAIKALSISDELFEELKESKKSQDFPENIGFVRHGTLDSPGFDGCHLGHPFFATRT